jgi:hypothetical protein
MENKPNSEHNTEGLRPWKKGQSGNPHGRRPKGMATVERLRAALVDDLPAILKTVVEAAKDGDLQAARTILERVLPAMKPIEAPVELDAVEGTLVQQGAAILGAMAGGTLTPGQAGQILGAIAQQSKIVEVDELSRRLTALEQRVGESHACPEPHRNA